MSEQTRHTVDPRFTYIERRNNKEVVLYVGLLDAAHRAGLVGISTEILQYPHPENDMTCIVRALVTQDLGEGFSRSFSGIGDANPQNVGKAIAPHFIRMAETRAKARALRDMLNIGMVTAEELGGDDDHAASPPANAPQTRQVAPYAPELREPTPRSMRVAEDGRAPEERNPNIDPYIAAAWVMVEDGKDVASIWSHLSSRRKFLSTEEWDAVVKDWKRIKAALDERDAAIAQRQPATV